MENGFSKESWETLQLILFPVKRLMRHIFSFLKGEFHSSRSQKDGSAKHAMVHGCGIPPLSNSCMADVQCALCSSSNSQNLVRVEFIL